MPPVTFETFDPLPYQRAPRLNLLGALALGRALLETTPGEPSQAVERTAAGLERVLDEGDQAMDARRRDSVPVDVAAELSFDGLTDTLWVALRDGLEALGGLGHEELPRVAVGHGKQSAVAKAVRAAQDKGRRARAVSAKLFGSDGVAFTRAQFPEQAQAMASILRVIEDDALAPEIGSLLGPEIVVLLRACQPHYEAMVKTRLARDGRKSSDLGKARAKILRSISRYTSAVLTMIDEDEPASLERVLAALLPLEQLRAAAGAGPAAPAEELEEDGAAEGEGEPSAG